MNESTSFRERPYVGLIPFREEDARYFFGRDKEREIITANLLAARLTLLYGPSGVGKSSVLRAGVAYHLHQLARQSMVRRGKPKFAVTFFNTWRDDPLSSLLPQVEQSVRQALGGQVVEPVPPGLSFVESLQEWSKRVQGHLLIILDQFEEYFLYHPNESGDGTFAVEFARAVNTPGLNVNFIVAYRDDAHAKLDFFKGSIPNLFENYYRIGYLDHDAARSAIERPIEQYNKLPTTKTQIQIEDGLVEAVLSQVRAGEKYLGEAGYGIVSETDRTNAGKWEVETPYLQLVMTRLWNVETAWGSNVLELSTLTRLGGARRIVQTHLDSAMGAFSTGERAMAASVFNYLVTPSGTKIAQTVTDLTEYAGLSATKEIQLGSMMKALAEGDKRILRVVPSPANQPHAPCYEVFHDVLAQAIIDWRRRYQARQQRKRFWTIVGVMSALLLFMGSLTAFAFQQRNSARRATVKANESARAAEESRRETVAALEIAQSAKEQAVKQKTIAEGTAAQNEELAVNNKQLAQRERAEAQHAKEQARLAEISKLEADQQRNVAVKALAETEAAKTEAEGRRVEAEQAKEKADDALALVKKLDSSVPYFKAIMRGSTEAVTRALYSPTGEFVVTNSDAEVNRPRVWNAATGALRAELDDECRPMDVAISPDSKYIATGCHSDGSGFNNATLWDAATGQQILVYGNRDFEIHGAKSVAFSPDSKFIVISPMNYPTALVFPVTEGGKVVTVLHGDTALFDSAVFSSDGRYILTISQDKAAQVWNAKGGEKVFTLSMSQTTFVAFSPRGKYLLRGSTDNTVRMWDVDTRVELTPLKHDSSIISVVFSPGEEQLATASGNTARVWDVKTGKLLATLGEVDASLNQVAPSSSALSGDTQCESRGHKAPLSSVAFSPNGKYIVTASADKTALVWDWKAQKVIAPLRGHSDAVLSAAFDQSSTYVLTGSADQTARVWEVFSSEATTASSREATIKGTYSFDFESGTMPTYRGGWPPSADVWWEQIDRRVRNLVPLNKTRLAYIGPLSAGDFDKLSLAELQGLNYSNTSISGNDDKGNQLSNGSVFAVITDGAEATEYAKVQVVSYGYDIKVRWVTYAKKK